MITRLGESRLESLLESAKLLNSTLELDELLKHLLRTVMGRLLVTRGAIAIRDQADEPARVAICRGTKGLAAGDPLTSERAAAAGLELFFDIGEPGREVGVLATARPLKGELELQEQDFLRALLGLAASGIANAQAHKESVRLNRSLDQKVQELRTLLDLVRALASTLDPDQVGHMVTLTLAGRWIVPKYGLATWRPGHPPVLRAKGLDITRLAGHEEAIAALPDAVVADPADAANGELWAALGLPAGALVMPIRAGAAQTCGVVICGPRPGRQVYSETDLEFGAGLVAQAAVAFENSWHFRETLGKKQLENELLLAANIQQDLFPKSLPDIPHTSLAARNRQARQVGGDYYDAIPMLPEGPDGATRPYLLCVVDISGKGVFASLLMSNIQATLRALLSRESALGPIAATTNDLLWATTPSNRYATAFLAVYEPESGGCKWVNAGHNEGILVRAADGSVERLECIGLALGLFPHRTYEEQFCRLGPRDVLVLYSDGVTDARNDGDDEFGTDALIDCVRAHAHRSPAEILDAIFEAVDRHAAGAPQFDDITVMVIQRSA
jgi:sigma-B regulation protein RsbU (phosphoserine phosphatase)